MFYYHHNHFPHHHTTAFLSPSTLCPFLPRSPITTSTSKSCSSPSKTSFKHSPHRRRARVTCISSGAELPDITNPSTPFSTNPTENEKASANGNGSLSMTNAHNTVSTESLSSDVLTTSTASAIYKFTRPHTIRGTILASFAGCARAIMESPVSINWGLLPRAFIGLAALLFGNAYIVGINQIYDVRLDKINKPYLPIASNELSIKKAWIIVVTSALLGLLFVKLYFSSLIFNLYSFGMVFATLYSIPPFRFKRYPILAAVTISCVRGFLLNFGVYHATKSALNIPFYWSPPIIFLACFMSIFATVIALAKDLPDIQGDRAEGIPTFASKVGPHRLIAIVCAMLVFNYAGAVLTAGLAPDGAFNRLALGIGHTLLAVWLISYMPKVEPNSKESIKKFYAFVWKLFYAEYLLFPFI